MDHGQLMNSSICSISTSQLVGFVFFFSPSPVHEWMFKNIRLPSLFFGVEKGLETTRGSLDAAISAAPGIPRPSRPRSERARQRCARRLECPVPVGGVGLMHPVGGVKRLRRKAAGLPQSETHPSPVTWTEGIRKAPDSWPGFSWSVNCDL